MQLANVKFCVRFLDLMTSYLGTTSKVAGGHESPPNSCPPKGSNTSIHIHLTAVTNFRSGVSFDPGCKFSFKAMGVGRICWEARDRCGPWLKSVAGFWIPSRFGGHMLASGKEKSALVLSDVMYMVANGTRPTNLQGFAEV